MRSRFVVLLIFGIVAVSGAAFADSITITPPKAADFVVVEGNSGLLTYTVTNTGANQVTIGGRMVSPVFKMGDSTDVPDLKGLKGSTCVTGLKLTPAGTPGDSCTIVVNFTTSNEPPENKDFGLTSLTVDVRTAGNGHATSTKDFTVNDCGLMGKASTCTCTTNCTVTPEPSSLLLLGTGVVGLVPVIRRKLRM